MLLTESQQRDPTNSLHSTTMPPSELKPKKRTKRKPSDLTTEEVSNVVSLLKNLAAYLDEEDEDGQIVIESVRNVIRKLWQDTVCFGSAHRHIVH